VLAAVLLVAAVPLFLLLAVLSLFLIGRPVFYRCRRLGMGGKEFTLYKFRTMKGGEKIILSPAQEKEWRLYGKILSDDRVTPWGRLLRRSSLDELPQLFNVVRGEMALVGPRPIVREEKVFCGRFCDRILSVKPGITGLWQVLGRNLVTYRRRNAINLWYVRHRSWELDIRIILKTFGAVISCRGAF